MIFDPQGQSEHGTCSFALLRLSLGTRLTSPGVGTRFGIAPPDMWRIALMSLFSTSSTVGTAFRGVSAGDEQGSVVGTFLLPCFDELCFCSSPADIRYDPMRDCKPIAGNLARVNKWDQCLLNPKLDATLTHLTCYSLLMLDLTIICIVKTTTHHAISPIAATAFFHFFLDSKDSTRPSHKKKKCL